MSDVRFECPVPGIAEEGLLRVAADLGISCSGPRVEEWDDVFQMPSPNSIGVQYEAPTVTRSCPVALDLSRRIRERGLRDIEASDALVELILSNSVASELNISDVIGRATEAFNNPDPNETRSGSDRIVDALAKFSAENHAGQPDSIISAY